MAEPEVISHWYQLIDGLQYSTKDFYEELGKEVESWKIPKGTTLKVEHSEGSALFSPKRLYFRVQRDDLIFDVCGAEFGRGFFVSWWLVMPPGCLMSLATLPGIGLLFRPFMKRFGAGVPRVGPGLRSRGRGVRRTSDQAAVGR
jgi:hypothetical protein